MTYISMWRLFFNWKAVVESFGFGSYYIYPGRHPFQVAVLLLGGVLDNVFDALNACCNVISRVLKSNAG